MPRSRVTVASIDLQPSCPAADRRSLKSSETSNPGSRRSSRRQPREPSMAARDLVPKSLPRSTNKSLHPARVFHTVDLDAAADVDPERAHLPNRRADVLWVETSREDNRKRGAN